MDGFLITIHLHTKGPSCKRMVRVAGNLDGFSILDFYQKPTGIRAIIGTNRPFDLSHHDKSPLLTSKYTLHPCLVQSLGKNLHLSHFYSCLTSLSKFNKLTKNKES